MGPWKMVSFFQEYHQERFSSRWQLVDGSEHNLLPVSLWVLPLWLAETSQSASLDLSPTCLSGSCFKYHCSGGTSLE